MELPRLCLMNQRGLGKKGKSINFISLLRVALGFRQPQSMNPVNKYLPGKYNAGSVSIITGAEELPRLTAFHRDASELICGADGSHLGGFIAGL